MIIQDAKKALILWSFFGCFTGSVNSLSLAPSIF